MMWCTAVDGIGTACLSLSLVSTALPGETDLSEYTMQVFAMAEPAGGAHLPNELAFLFRATLNAPEKCRPGDESWGQLMDAFEQQWPQVLRSAMPAMHSCLPSGFSVSAAHTNSARVCVRCGSDTGRNCSCTVPHTVLHPGCCVLSDLLAGI